MKTLYALIMTTALTATAQLAIASDYNNSGHQDNQGTYGVTYGGYWRTFDYYNNKGWGKHDDMRKPHGVDNWNDCFYECKNDHNCKGIEFQSKKHGKNVCEIHYDPFAHCEKSSSNNGQSSENKSTCWVKAYPGGISMNDNTDTSSDDDS